MPSTVDTMGGALAARPALFSGSPQLQSV
jgi:hypothetical protein